MSFQAGSTLAFGVSAIRIGELYGVGQGDEND